MPRPMKGKINNCGTSTRIMRTDFSDGQLYQPHCNREYEILFVLKGSVNFDLEGEHILLKENSGIVIEPLQYQVVSGNADAYHRVILFFDLLRVPEEIREAFVKRIQKRYVFSSPEMTQMFRKYVAAVEKGERYKVLRDALFTVILYSIALDDSIAKKTKISAKTEKLRQILAILDKNIASDVHIGDIAQQVHMSQSAVYRLFKEEMKISLKPYILQKKMLYAETLLQQGTAPGEVALACGYKNYASFYKVFLKITGKTPGKA